jgi:hypothetical protein
MITEIKNQNLLEQSTIAAIKRKDEGFGIDGSLDGLFGYTPDDVESTKGIEVITSGDLSEVLKEFVNYLDNEDDDKSHLFSNIILTPDEINRFVNHLPAFESYERYIFDTGKFVSNLVKQSYQSSHNNFHFDLNGVPLFYGLCSYISGNSEFDRIKINIKGDVGMSLFRYSNYINTIIDGNVGGSFADNSNSVTAKIDGNVGGNCGCASKRLVIKINGEVKKNCAYLSTNFMGIIKGNIGSDFGNLSRYLIAAIDGEVGYSSLLHANNLQIVSNSPILYKYSRINNPKYRDWIIDERPRDIKSHPLYKKIDRKFQARRKL